MAAVTQTAGRIQHGVTRANQRCGQLVTHDVRIRPNTGFAQHVAVQVALASESVRDFVVDENGRPIVEQGPAFLLAIVQKSVAKELGHGRMLDIPVADQCGLDAGAQLDIRISFHCMAVDEQRMSGHPGRQILSPLKTLDIRDQHPGIVWAIVPARHAPCCKSASQTGSLADQANAASAQAVKNLFSQRIEMVDGHGHHLEHA